MPDPATKAHEAIHDADEKNRNRTPSKPSAGLSNEITCEDKKGKQVLHVRGARDWYAYAMHNRFECTDGQQTQLVGKRRKRSLVASFQSRPGARGSLIRRAVSTTGESEAKR